MKELSLDTYREKYFDQYEITGRKPTLYETESEDCRLPVRQPRSHKYSYGRALIIGGCRGFSGAPVLAANACERSGAGLTHLMVPESIYEICASRCDGAVVTPIASGKDGEVREQALERILTELEKADACVAGPGLGHGEGAQIILSKILREASCPLVLDADALTICGMNPQMLSSCKVPLILTPHEGEFRRLGGDLSGGRLNGAMRFSEKYPNVILILKGYGSLICAGEQIAVNPTGSSAMAKGGAGDVLSGILCAFLAQGFEPLFSAEAAVYLHGLAGDLACREYGEYSVTPSDLIRFLPRAFRTAAQPETE